MGNKREQQSKQTEGANVRKDDELGRLFGEIDRVPVDEKLILVDKIVEKATIGSDDAYTLVRALEKGSVLALRDAKRGIRGHGL